MRDHSAKSESKTTARQVSQLHHIQRNNVIVFNPGAISVAGRNFLRRQRWRFRPLKRLILPARSMKRAAVEFIGPFFGRTILRSEERRVGRVCKQLGASGKSEDKILTTERR